MSGFVSIVGAGPWDPSLLTLAGRSRLRRAEVVIADYLANPNLLLHAPPDAEIIQRTSGPRGGTQLRQEQLNALLVKHAKAGKYVVRLKGGDPCMFGRGAEEAQVLVEAGIEFELIPGVSSPIAAAEAAGIPVTHREHTPAVTFVSGYEAYDKAGLGVAWQHLAQSAGTIVMMMSVKNARMNAKRLVDAGRDPTTPAAIVRWGTRGIQHTVVGRLDNIADRIEAEGLRAPAILVVGEVVGVRSEIGWKEKLPLFGRRIVVTRPRGQHHALCDTLNELGADVVALPCLAIVASEDPAALHNQVQRLAEVDGLVLSSRPGVEAFFAALAHCELDVRALAGKHVVAVGPATAEACAQRGLRADLVPAAASSEGIIAALRERGWLGATWLHVRAEDGRRALGEAIKHVGGRYRLAIGYRSVRPTPVPSVLRQLLPASAGGEGVDAICFASGRSARHMVELVTEAHGEAAAQALFDTAKIVSLGPVTTAAIEKLGLNVAATAQQPSDAGLVAALRGLFA